MWAKNNQLIERQTFDANNESMTSATIINSFAWIRFRFIIDFSFHFYDLFSLDFWPLGSGLEYAPPEGAGHAYRSTPLEVRNIYTKDEVTVARGGGVIAI